MVTPLSLFVRLLAERLFGRYCQKHHQRYRSQLCLKCVRTMAVRFETQQHVSGIRVGGVR